MRCALICFACAVCFTARAQVVPATPIKPTPPAPVVNQSAGKSAAAPTPAAAPAPVMPTTAGEDLDRIVAIVNGDLVLDSDVNEEIRFDAFQPYDGTPDTSRNKALERLINRDLIVQQSKLTPEGPITDAAVDKEIQALRKTIPECKKYNCETDAGWQSFLASHGFTPDSFHARWRIRMQVLRFIEERFRMGVRITPDQIKAYYEKTILPEYANQHAPPPLASLTDRIQEVLLQQQVSSLLNDWLTSLRAQGTVVILKPGEVAP